MSVKRISIIAVIIENICTTRQEHEHRSWQAFLRRKIAESVEAVSKKEKKDEKILRTQYNKIL